MKAWAIRMVEKQDFCCYYVFNCPNIVNNNLSSGSNFKANNICLTLKNDQGNQIACEKVLENLHYIWYITTLNWTPSLTTKAHSCTLARLSLKFPTFFFFKFNFYLFIYLWLCWVFVSVRGLSPAAASGGRSSSRCAGLSSSQPLLPRSIGSRHAGSVIVAHGPSRSAACGILPDQGLNPRSLHRQADSQPPHHQGSPKFPIFNCSILLYLSMVNTLFFLFSDLLCTFGFHVVK